MSKLPRLVETITSYDGINDKTKLSALVAKEFELQPSSAITSIKSISMALH